MITSQQAIDKTIEIVSAAFPSISGETGGSHFYGDVQIDEHLFVKFRVANHGIYIQTLISHANGIPPELKETISIVYRNSTMEPIGTKTTTKGYEPTIVVMQYVYPCWDMHLPDVVVVANEIISFLKTGEFKPPFICTKDVLVQYVESDSGVKDVTKQFRDYYCPKKGPEQRTVQLKESDLRAIIRECLCKVLSEQSKQMIGDYEIMDGDGLEHEADSIIQFGHFNDIRMYVSNADTYCLMKRCDNGSYFFTQIVDAPELGEKETKFKPVKPKDVPSIILRDAQSLIRSSATLRNLLF